MYTTIIFAQESGGGNGIGTIIVVLILGVLGYAGFRAYQARKEETSESRSIKSLPPSIQHVVVRMDSDTQNAFFNEYEKRKKYKSVGWIWLVVPFSWHYIYVRQVGTQFAFWLTFGGFGIWWIVDVFRMPRIIGSTNEDIARTAIHTLGIAASFGRDAGPQGTGEDQQGSA